MDYAIDDIEPANLDLNIDDPHPVDEVINAETLIAAYHSIMKSWDTKRRITEQRIPTLLSRSWTRPLQLENLRPLDIFQSPTHSTSGLKFFPTTILKY